MSTVALPSAAFPSRWSLRQRKRANRCELAGERSSCIATSYRNAPGDAVAIGRRALSAAGHEVQDALPSEAPSAPDLVPGNDPLLGQSIDGFHVDLEESGHLRGRDYFLQRPLTPSRTLNLPRAPG